MVLWCSIGVADSRATYPVHTTLRPLRWRQRVEKVAHDPKESRWVSLEDVIMARTLDKVGLAPEVRQAEPVEPHRVRHVDHLILGPMHDQHGAAHSTEPSVVWVDVAAHEDERRATKARRRAAGRRREHTQPAEQTRQQEEAAQALATLGEPRRRPGAHRLADEHDLVVGHAATRQVCVRGRDVGVSARLGRTSARRAVPAVVIRDHVHVQFEREELQQLDALAAVHRVAMRPKQRNVGTFTVKVKECDAFTVAGSGEVRRQRDTRWGWVRPPVDPLELDRPMIVGAHAISWMRRVEGKMALKLLDVAAHARQHA